MRTTRSRAIASHCIIVKVPVEIVTQILKYANIQASDLAAVAATCRYLRAIASPLLLQTISFVGDKKSSFAPLEALVGNAAKGALVRSLIIQEPKVTIASNRAVIYSNILGQALDVLVHLTSLSVPFALLNPTIFTKIYNSSSIETLSISPIHSAQNSLDLSSRVALPAREKALVVNSLETELVGSHYSICTTFISNLLDFLFFHSIDVSFIKLGYFHPRTLFAPFLTSNPFRSLVGIEISMFPPSFNHCIGWLNRVIAAQPSLLSLDYSVCDFLEGFELGHNSWARFLDGNVVRPNQSFDDAWAGVMVRKLRLRMERTDATKNFTTTNIEVRLPLNTSVKPSHLQVIFDFEPGALSLVLVPASFRASKCLRWSDWFATARTISSHRNLQSISLFCSVTPTPTVSNTIACSPSCFDSLLRTHPSLHAATELVGGYERLFELSVTLNLERLRVLESSPDGEIVDILWVVVGKKEVVVEFDGTAVEASEGGTTKLVFKEVGEGLKSLEEKISACYCFSCGGETMEDPLSAIRRCGTAEVRAALALGGFDLDAFDARPPTQPVEQDSFETFLRSTS